MDEMIQFSMANRTLDAAPDTMVLLTGDGSGYTDGKDFIKQLEHAHKHGWKIEVVSWDAGCNRYLRQFAEKNGVYPSIAHWSQLTNRPRSSTTNAGRIEPAH